MISLKIVLLLLALICFLLAAVGVQAPRINLMALGLTFGTGALLVA